MKRGLQIPLLTAAILAATLLTFAWTPATTPAASGSLAQFMPHGAVLFLEARDFSGMLHDWSAYRRKRIGWRAQISKHSQTQGFSCGSRRRNRNLLPRLVFLRMRIS
jgi:hypothetical protein